jgi:ubiquinone/menaquinone biosynthesis C-methylase UbiE
MNKVVIDIGCGKHKVKGAFGIDISKACDINIIYDANLPLPLKNNSVDRIIMRQVLEHMRDTIKIMIEIHRVLKKGGIFVIEVPHVGSLQAFADPTHKNFFTMQSMNFFTENHPTNYYSEARFRIVKREFKFMRGYGWIAKIFNLRPDFFEKMLKVLPLHASIYWELEKI